VFIDLVDDLRCPRPHHETWLVAASELTDGRDIIEGTLGCPVCRAEYPIRDGVVWFTEPGEAAAATATSEPDGDPELALRLAAFLDLSDGPGLAVLAGSWAPAAPLLREVVPTHLVLLNPRPPVPAGNGVSVVQALAGIPLANGSCRGVALDDANADAIRLGAATRVLAPRGRLVAPAPTPAPDGVTELVRDAQVWVAERTVPPPRLVSLQPRRAAP
jgi:uncharacterized protein YbaR (Trm112 family)